MGKNAKEKCEKTGPSQRTRPRRSYCPKFVHKDKANKCRERMKDNKICLKCQINHECLELRYDVSEPTSYNKPKNCSGCNTTIINRPVQYCLIDSTQTVPVENDSIIVENLSIAASSQIINEDIDFEVIRTFYEIPPLLDPIEDIPRIADK